ncbi:MAG: PepSY-associated TM helix domain-containing protein [Trueperaceae bacterium]
MTASTQPKRVRIKVRPLIQKIHLWTTLIVGLFIVAEILSGTLLMFRPELEPLVYSRLYKATPGDAPLEDAKNSVTATYADYSVEGVDLPITTHGPYRFYLYHPDTGHELSVFVDPGTGQINGDISEEGGIFGWLFVFHRNLFISDNAFYEESYMGYILVGFIGIALLLMLMTGFFLWWPGLKRWAVAFVVRNKSTYIRTYDLHKLIGLVTLIPLTVVTLVMLPYSFEGEGVDNTLAAINWPRGTEDEEVYSTGTGQPSLSLDELIAKAEALIPDSQATDTYFIFDDPTAAAYISLTAGYNPSRGTGLWEGNVHVYLDRYTGEALFVNDTRKWPFAAQTIDSNMWMGIHMGTWGGVTTRILETLVGIAALYLAWTGIRQWWLKRTMRLKQKHQRNTTTQPNTPTTSR